MTTSPQITTLEAITERRPTVLAIGVFDGVHRGHQQLLHHLVSAAHRQAARSAVLTFFPHPAEVIRRQSGRYYLTTLDERLHLLAAQGVDLVIPFTFDETTRTTRAADFIAHIDHHLDLHQLWGGDFALGYQREGDLAFLTRLGSAMGFTVHAVTEKLLLDGERVSSSRIRRGLANGNLADVNACLGRRFTVSGSVTQGQQRGRTIGFPTANLAVWEKQSLPAHGVYAAQAEVDGAVYGAATNVGVRPTVNGHGVTVEAHLLDFAGDLYGKTVRLSFVERVRPEMKFAGLEALKTQIAADVMTIRRILDQAQAG